MEEEEKYKFVQQLEEKCKKYVASKLKSNGNESPCNFLYPFKICKAAQILVPQYDLGIELAIDGLWPGYIFHLYGLPTKAVKLGRKARGASWQPLEELTSEDIRGKKVLLLEFDMITGRTLKRAVKELSKFFPAYMDLFLIHKTNFVTVKNYKKWKEKYSFPLPRIGNIYTSDPTLKEKIRKICSRYHHIWPTNVREIPKGLEINYYCESNYGYKLEKVVTIQLNDKDALFLDPSGNIPKEIRKVMTIQEDFPLEDFPTHFEEDIIADLEKILRDK